MKKAALAYFLCPSCRSQALQMLDAKISDSVQEVEEGWLRCGQCGAEMRVRGSVPRFVPDDGYADSFGFRWNHFRRTQLDSYTAMVGWKYLLRPITKRLPQRALFRLVQGMVALLLRPAIIARRFLGHAGARLFPILQHSHLGLPLELNRAWAVLDTFDMYAPAHDHPQSLAQMRRWCEECGLDDIQVEYGPNGVIARARVPVMPSAQSAAAQRGG
jgi:uncharacterized protein YbaR (Trm112 family)